MIAELKRLEAAATGEPWELGEYDECLGYDCMTGGIRFGPGVLDGHDYGQGNCKEISAEAVGRITADAALRALEVGK